MLHIVSQAIPPDNGDAYRSAVATARAALERAVAERLPAGASFGDRERALLVAANDACRLALATTLQATAEAQPDHVRIEGVLYKRHHDGTVVYHSLCEPLPVRRATYREPGERNGPTVVPLDLAMGLIEGATPALAYRVALGYAQGPGRHAEEQMHADHRRPPSRSTLERLGKAIGTHTHRTAPRIEPVLQIALDQCGIGVAERFSLHVARVLAKHTRHRFSCRFGNWVQAAVRNQVEAGSAFYSDELLSYEGLAAEYGSRSRYRRWSGSVRCIPSLVGNTSTRRLTRKEQERQRRGRRATGRNKQRKLKR